jgi:hypothetical protein
VWFTAASNPHTFTAAGRHGFHLLTALLNLTTAELEERIITYRKAREEAGHDPAGGHRDAHGAWLGVDEIACLIDFGMDLSSTLASMRRMVALLPQATACPPR